jgi:hypothetical protein
VERDVVMPKLLAFRTDKLEEPFNLRVGQSTGICGIRDPKDTGYATKLFLILHVSSLKEPDGTLTSEKSATAIGFT